MVMEIEELMNIPGIGRVTVKKLVDAGYSPELLLVTPLHVISRDTGISEDRVMAIVEYIREVRSRLKGFMTAKEYMDIRNSIERISTGCTSLDKLLNGGIETNAITEFVGEFGVGKTQICHQLAVMVQLSKDEGGLNGRAVYIDSEGTFRPERIVNIAENRGLDPEIILENIIYGRVYNSDHQMFLIKELFKIVEEKNIRLIIIDSLITHFRSEYPGREYLAVRQQKLNKHIHDLLNLALLYNIAVVITNQVVANPDLFSGEMLKPTGGNIIAHSSTYRIWIKKAGGKRIARIIDSPYHPEIECVFKITEKGIEDI
ncbi:MAG TPA: DNA repair and recombination protein RadA [Thermoprotei archaeon]|nr:DNA repair and recombination protein RadA [Thermoprotei archaeon]